MRGHVGEHAGSPGLGAVVHAELGKILRRPAYIVLALLAAAAHIYLARLQPYLSFLDVQGAGEGVPGWVLELRVAEMQPVRAVDAFLISLLPFVVTAAAVFGALLSGSEHAWKTVRTVHTQGPGRGLVSSGRVIAASVVVLALCTALLAVTLGVTFLISGLHGLETVLPPAARVAAALGIGWLVLMLPCLAGMLLASVFRSAAAGITICLVWLFLIQNVAMLAGTSSAFAAAWHSVDPMANATGAAMLFGVPGVAEGAAVFEPVPPLRGVTVTGLYSAVLAALAVWLPTRGDITA